MKANGLPFFFENGKEKRTMDGFWFDPKHGGCLRRIVRVDATTYHVRGVYGDDEAIAPGQPWTAVIAWSDGCYRVDFAGKPTKKTRFLTVRHRGRRLVWCDGNVWRRMYLHTGQLR
jgi:hypothetical protein